MINYDPKELLRRIAPEKKVKKLVSKGASLKRSALSFVDDVEFLDKKAVTRVALETVKSYKKRIDADPDAKKGISKNPKFLVNRVQNEVVMQVSKEIQNKYGDEWAEWLPSDAETPDPEHQLNYGKRFKISEGINGEIPGQRFGCRCGMRILVKESKLDLG